jgi:hypothetical protein
MRERGIPAVEYPDYVEVLRATRPDLAADVAPFRGLGKVMDWMKGHGIALGAVEIIHQDEYSLDFVVPIDPGGTHLAFGIT